MASLLLLVAGSVRAQDRDLDSYTWRVDALWWLSQPSGFFNSSGNAGSFDLARDFHFGNYSTFTGTLDWRFKRKHHLLFSASPVESSHTVSLARTITFQGRTYNVGTAASADIHSLSLAPGYQYDIIRRNRGFLAFTTQVYLINTSAKLSGVTTVNGQTRGQTSSGSVFAPLPAIGTHARWYPLHDSARLSFDGYVDGMYFFGYGDFLSARGAVNVGLISHLNLTAGYQMGTRLSIHGKTDQIGIRLTQQGAVAGLEASW